MKITRFENLVEKFVPWFIAVCLFVILWALTGCEPNPPDRLKSCKTTIDVYFNDGSVKQFIIPTHQELIYMGFTSNWGQNTSFIRYSFYGPIAGNTLAVDVKYFTVIGEKCE